MDQVREHLRLFRQKLETRTQEIRNSNMALMESLRQVTQLFIYWNSAPILAVYQNQ